MRSSRPNAHVAHGATLARVLCSTLLASGFALLPAPAASQGTASDYARSEGLRARIDDLVIDAAEVPIWIGPPSNQFVYRKSVQGGSAFVLADAVTLEKRPAFDHERLAASIAATVKRPGGPPITGKALPLGRLAYVDSGRAIEFTLTPRPGELQPDTTRWRCTLADYACGRARPDSSLRTRRQVGGGLFGTPPAPDARPRLSPDGKLEALVQNYNVGIRAVGSRDITLLSTDGSEGDACEPAAKADTGDAEAGQFRDRGGAWAGQNVDRAVDTARQSGDGIRIAGADGEDAVRSRRQIGVAATRRLGQPMGRRRNQVMAPRQLREQFRCRERLRRRLWPCWPGGYARRS